MIGSEARPKIEEHQSHRERIAEYALSYAYTPFLSNIDIL